MNKDCIFSDAITTFEHLLKCSNVQMFKCTYDTAILQKERVMAFALSEKTRRNAYEREGVCTTQEKKATAKS